MGTQAEAPEATAMVASSTTKLVETDPVKIERARQLAELRERNAHAAAIRGTQWGKELNGMALSAVAHYCTINRLDPARHVEVLGGRIYLTGELYMERGAPLLLKRLVTMDEPDYVHEDAGLTAMTTDPDADPEFKVWSRAERLRRFQTRVTLGIPHDATGACVIRLRVPGTSTVIVGTNWCGGATKVKRRKNPKPGEAGEYRGDPVGDAEPTKTAQTRALRRAWRQVMAVLPEYGEDVGRLEAAAVVVNTELKIQSERDAEAAEVSRQMQNKPMLPAMTDADPYAVEAPPTPPQMPSGGPEDAEGVVEEPQLCEEHGTPVVDGICDLCEREFDTELDDG